MTEEQLLQNNYLGDKTMCILCEPKYEEMLNGKKSAKPITKTVIFSTDRTVVTDELQYNDEGFYIEDGVLGCTVEAGYAGDSIPINFCPICGKKLERMEIK